VPVREASVVIAVSSAHRHDALVALQYLIDTLKARVPIWKKEWYADDTGAWKANAEARVVARDPAPAPGPDPHPPVVAKEDTGLCGPPPRVVCDVYDVCVCDVCVCVCVTCVCVCV
jgi:hypothetical protein